MQTRRKFLRDCSFLAASTALVPVALPAQTLIAKPPFAEMPGLAEFRGQLNTPFTCQQGGVSLQLVEATASPVRYAGAATGGNGKFSLFFHGPAYSPLAQNTYEFDHAGLGRLAMFIVPVGRPLASHCCYEAVFDRPANAAELARLLSSAPKRAAIC